MRVDSLPFSSRGDCGGAPRFERFRNVCITEALDLLNEPEGDFIDRRDEQRFDGASLFERELPETAPTKFQLTARQILRCLNDFHPSFTSAAPEMSVGVPLQANTPSTRFIDLPF